MAPTPQVVMTPSPGQATVAYVGDHWLVNLELHQVTQPNGWRAYVRTTIAGGRAVIRELAAPITGEPWVPGAAQRDVALTEIAPGRWRLAIALAEIGSFVAKAFVVDPQGHSHWPAGDDARIVVHPAWTRTANTLYCAFTRQFGDTRHQRSTTDTLRDQQLAAFDQHGWTVIPPSGTFRDLTAQLDHIFDRLGCRILHLLPINPTPTTHARYGRFGSPYAATDFTSVDPALVVHDRRTSGLDQFRELADGVHRRDGRLFIDLAVNHTGWMSQLQEMHPEWFVRNADGSFHSPGAWGTTWEDLVELDHQVVELWSYLADALLTWCRRGVDGFRCDAGYMIPTPVWRAIVATVQREFPDTVFLLEGLGGAWSATADLLTEGRMQWAYSELFQNYSHTEISDYLDHMLHHANQVGLLVHYAETHDNDRLAAQGRAWSVHRNRVCALTSHSGGYGITNGVEWLADEKIQVHQSRGLNWGSEEHVIDHIAGLNQLLSDHPCFHDGATCQRISPRESPVVAVSRLSADGQHQVIIVINPDRQHEQSYQVPAEWDRHLGDQPVDLLASHAEVPFRTRAGRRHIVVAPLRCMCLTGPVVASSSPTDELTSSNHTADWWHGGGKAYRRLRQAHAAAVQVLAAIHGAEHVGLCSWQRLAERLAADPVAFVRHALNISAEACRHDPIAALEQASTDQASTDQAHSGRYPSVLVWQAADRDRVMPVPPNHWVVVCDQEPFRYTWTLDAIDHASAHNQHTSKASALTQTIRVDGAAIATDRGYIAIIAPAPELAAADLASRSIDSIIEVRCCGDQHQTYRGTLRHLPQEAPSARAGDRNSLLLLTNGRGGMARLRGDFGTVRSKYDCVLGANLHPQWPVDRHVFVKRLRAWLRCGTFTFPIDGSCLESCHGGETAIWQFRVPGGSGREIPLTIRAHMPPDRNTTVFDVTCEPLVTARLHEKICDQSPNNENQPHSQLTLILRPDVEDRSFHSETTFSAGADHHFSTALSHQERGCTFAFAADRQLSIACNTGLWHPDAEWATGIPHPIETDRGQAGHGDAYSPGWFEIPIEPGLAVQVRCSAEITTNASDEPAPLSTSAAANSSPIAPDRSIDDILSPTAKAQAWQQQLDEALGSYVVSRDQGSTVIAGYPWFLDWGRDTLIVARGMLAAGRVDEVVGILNVFGRFEDGGTLPNCIHGGDASNRETSDAALWYAVVAEETAEQLGSDFYSTTVDGQRKIIDVLRDIAVGHLAGTSTGVSWDSTSGLVWSPSHFTWMDTNHPAGTPRAGYPIEIQVLWWRLLRLLAELDVPPAPSGHAWSNLAQQVLHAIDAHFWLEDRGWWSDVLHAPAGTPASQAVVDTSLRSNCLHVVALDAASGIQAQRCVQAATAHLVVPGALRSLAPLPVTPPLHVPGPDGQALIDPLRPYQGHYRGDEDTQRKPAYHNGTAWTWPYPVYVEALAKAWPNDSTAQSTAGSYLLAMDQLLQAGCHGHLPEICDGNAPHQERGCDAQAWGVSEALRVWKRLND